MPISDSILVEAVDASILDTVEAFIRFRPGFHGDTGIRDYLYHRLMTRLPGGGLFAHSDRWGTLLAQAEWYTALKYRRTGNASSRGRFDLGIPHPLELDLVDPRPLVAFECGRNKAANRLVGDVDASADHEGPEPADITKLAREIAFASLPYGYALEFYDENRSEAETLIRLLRGRIIPGGSDKLRVVILDCEGGADAMLTFLPDRWAEILREKFTKELESIERLICTSHRGRTSRNVRMRGYGNRVPSEAFLSSCSAPVRALMNMLQAAFGDRVKLIFGTSTMTVNRWPTGKLFRIDKASESVSELDPVISAELAALLGSSTRTFSYKIDGTERFQKAVVKAVGRVVEPLLRIDTTFVSATR